MIEEVGVRLKRTCYATDPGRGKRDSGAVEGTGELDGQGDVCAAGRRARRAVGDAGVVGKTSEGLGA